MRFLSLIFLFLIGFSLNSVAQNTASSTEEVKGKGILFFSNNGCGKCETSQSFFDENGMPYTKLLVKENRPLMYEYIHQKTDGKNVAIGYPVIVYGDSIYFSIKNIQATLKELKQLMMIDKVLEQPYP